MEWIRKYRRSIIVVFLVCIVGVPIGIHCLFKLKSSEGFFVAEWSAGEILTYCGTVLSFLATSFLSILALWQNTQIKKESEHYRARLERMEQKKEAPIFFVEYQQGINYCQNMVISITNVSENVAVSTILKDFSLIRGDKYTWFDTKERFLGMMIPKKSMEISLKNPCLRHGDAINVVIICKDIFNNEVRCNFRGDYVKNNNQIKFYPIQINYGIDENEIGKKRN